MRQKTEDRQENLIHFRKLNVAEITRKSDISEFDYFGDFFEKI